MEAAQWPATAGRQQALAGLVDRSVGYEQALVDARVQTRLGDGSIDIDVQGALVNPFTGAGIKRLASGPHGSATRHREARRVLVVHSRSEQH
jgi:hypothetical protein